MPLFDRTGFISLTHADRDDEQGVQRGLIVPSPDFIEGARYLYRKIKKSFFHILLSDIFFLYLGLPKFKKFLVRISFIQHFFS